MIVFGLTGWTITIYLTKKDSKKLIKEEVANLLDICKLFFLSLKSLTVVLAKYSFSSDSIESTPIESCGINANPLEVVDPIEAVEKTGTIPSVEKVDEDTVLSSFSPELVEVITEEEEKIA
tara:strand:- start:246 stop:608 length:363 start_codon:yes stop_codon:yes gene_type:complete